MDVFKTLFQGRQKKLIRSPGNVRLSLFDFDRDQVPFFCRKFLFGDFFPPKIKDILKEKERPDT